MAIMTAGTVALWRYGGGLPMSAFPPERLVSRGIYRYLADPLYVGAVAVAIGASLIYASPSGLWIASPLFALACVAWVMGFERERMRQRFGVVAEPVLRVPAVVDDAPTWWHRAAAYAFVFIPWLAIYLSVEFLGTPPNAPSSGLPLDAMIPVIPWTAILYESVYPMVALAPLFARRQRDLRLFARRGLLWEWLRRLSEHGANSWREWSIGPLRLLSHGLFMGLAVALTFPIGIWLGGPDLLSWIFAASLVGAIAAALWAQLIEGSPQLLRPFGYFGGMIGVIVTVIAAVFAGVDAWRFLAACCVLLAFGQGLGRLRCLVNGCCHGRPAPAAIGITYVHPMPRPTRLANLGGVPIHPTQIYSLLWLMVVGFALTRLWIIAASLSFIAGMYFVLVGLGRFVEEHYRGEPQTAVIGTASFGMDVPGSHRRFSRLA
ncbi:MAG: hypothetical protein C0497_10365 [Gemmatimonas sp.]|nr:hypothetical protein [Gemmatimonas sp.]